MHLNEEEQRIYSCINGKLLTLVETLKDHLAHAGTNNSFGLPNVNTQIVHDLILEYAHNMPRTKEPRKYFPIYFGVTFITHEI
jgi:hypothetical protein